MPLNFDLVKVNPNDSTGGGGTLSAEMHDADATGPYFVFPATEMDSAISPYVVVAASEVRLMASALARYESGDLDAMAGGELSLATPTVTTDTGAGHGDASPEFDIDDPAGAIDFARFARGA